PSMAQIYDGHPWLLGPTWAFAQETAVHALRLMASGLFDRYPSLTIILGHMGEGLPYNMWRVDNRNAWVKAPPAYPAKKKLSEYFQANFYLTTSGNFRTQTLIDAILEVGADRILFSTDWPFENIDHAADWFDAAAISENDRGKIGRANSVRLFKLKMECSRARGSFAMPYVVDGGDAAVPDVATLKKRAERIGAIARERAVETERARRVSGDLVDMMREAGLFRIMQPRR